MATAQQITNAVREAMNKQVAFSWIDNRSVQAGVYLNWSQEIFSSLK